MVIKQARNVASFREHLGVSGQSADPFNRTDIVLA
jgi:hypothetical protein